ncbi:PaREP1 family protein [Saccharolobus sp.]|uniref:PaREP1 family protein n=1 Tax=Saccharolobus sp. TaxID=2100761 RepID=UPI003181CCC1
MSEAKDTLLIELANLLGWDKEDIAVDLTDRHKHDAEWYKNLAKRYRLDAQLYLTKCDYKNASKRLFGSVLALIKANAIMHNEMLGRIWEKAELESVINRLPAREKLSQLLNDANALVEFASCCQNDAKTFEEKFRNVNTVMESLLSK